MFRPDQWPFTPVFLSEIIDRDTLSVIQSGCCERLGRPLTILDCNPGMQVSCRRVESINEKLRYQEFCRFLRRGEPVRGGDEACKKEDIKQAQASLLEFDKTCEPLRRFTCYMGLQEMTYVIRIRQRPVAVVFSGQYGPPEGTDGIRQAVQRLGAGDTAGVQLNDADREQLLALARQLAPLPADAYASLEREALHVQRIAEAEFERGKREWEQDFLDRLRQASIKSEEVSNRTQLQHRLQHILETVQDFCRTEYVVFFGSVQEKDTVLAPIAQIGVPPEISNNLHFNWKKAGLLPKSGTEASNVTQSQPELVAKGLRGDNSKYFTSAECLIPILLSDRYRGVLVLGPFAEPVDMQEEQRFLTEVANTIGLFALTGLEVLYLERERKRWKSTATLLTHQVRTALTPITNQIGRAKLLTQGAGQDSTMRRVVEFLKRAEDLSLRLADGASQTLAGHVLQLERDDLEFEQYPLSVLVANCVEGFVPQAEKRHRQLVIDKNVELLPDAEVDVARLTIAISNLIENAIKYSYPNTTIYIRAHPVSISDPALAAAVIEIDDIGDEIRADALSRIFEEGTRGLTEAKMGRIPGSGLGLWEARAVVQAHGGEIGVTCEPTSIQRPQGAAFRVVFSVRIPLTPKSVKSRG